MKHSGQSKVITFGAALGELLEKIISHYGGLAKVGYVLAEKALKDRGFGAVHKIGDKARWARRNRRRYRISYGSLVASKRQKKYLIQLETRHRIKKNIKENKRYKLIASGFKGDFREDVRVAERRFRAKAHWIAVSIDVNCTYSVFFGSLAQLGGKSAIPMGVSKLSDYVCLVRDEMLPDTLVIPQTGRDEARELREHTDQFRLRIPGQGGQDSEIIPVSIPK